MFRQILQQFKYRFMARQLRRPKGSSGNRVGHWMNKANALLYEQTIALMQPAAGEQLLEIGFGNGHFFNQLISTAPGLQVKGIDFSPTMVKEARAQHAAAIATGQLELVTGNSNQLPFASDSLDKVYCINVIYFWDDPQTHLLEIKRVLKPGGRFYATIRTAASMERIPFTRYGFKKYTRESWEAQVGLAGLEAAGAVDITEPATEKGEALQSVCLVAVKPMD